MPKILPVLGSFNVHTFPDLRFTSAGAAGVRHEEHRIANSWGTAVQWKIINKNPGGQRLVQLAWICWIYLKIFCRIWASELWTSIVSIWRFSMLYMLKWLNKNVQSMTVFVHYTLQPWNSTTYCFHCFVLRKDHCCGKDLPATNPGDSSIERHESFETELYGRTANLDPENPARGKEPVSQRKNLPTCIISKKYPIIFIVIVTANVSAKLWWLFLSFQTTMPARLRSFKDLGSTPPPSKQFSMEVFFRDPRDYNM